LPDPFSGELVLVPARGIERWLSQRLSHHLGAGDHHDGICAGVEFRTPRSLVSEVLATGPDDPWAPDNLVWPVLRVIDDGAGEPWCAPLDRHLGRDLTGHDAEVRRGRRFALARRLAGLLASYATQRPQQLTAWEEGDDTDGAGGTIAADLTWQPELWRRLVHATDEPTPSQRHAGVLADLRESGASVDLPPRFSLFGHTRIAATEIELLHALGTHRDVHVWLPHPSAALWDRLTGLSGAVPRSADTSHERVAHPLLASLGRDVRELQRSLGSVAEDAPDRPADVDRPDTLLGMLQHDLASDVRPDPAQRSMATGDRSVQVHACHGPARQVEVLREVLLGLLDDDATLEPRDILVMCPDIESYAPLIEAAFGFGQVGDVSATSALWHPGHRLQVRLADRSLTQTNPLLSVVDTLLDLAGGRMEASRVLDLIATAPVRRRFGLSEDDLETITRWVEDAGVRWALDTDDRASYGLDHFLQNTWRFGLDRVLAGVAVSDDAERWIDTVLPLDDVGSNSIDLAGRVAELVDRLQRVGEQLTGTHPVGHWLRALRDGVDALTAVPWGEEWQEGQVHRELAEIGAEHGDDTELRLADVRALMAERLAGRPTRANFRSGSLTVCTMVPMRSVPHRVVCLLGLDDGVFPRNTIVDGDDVLARTPLTGERDPRSEDRQLLLDAVMSAVEHLVVTYTGADEVSGQPRPPAVPLGELLDALDETVSGATRHVLRHHPLQPFDPVNLSPGRLDPDRPFSFDAASLAGARASVHERHVPAGFDAGALPAAPVDDIDLATLIAFVQHPVKEFLRRRAQIVLPDEGTEVLDGLPVDVDNLVEWGIGERLLHDRLRDRDDATALGMEWRRGMLPPGRLGWREAQRIRDEAAPVGDVVAPLLGDIPVTSLDVDVDLGDGRRIRGTVNGVHGDRVVRPTYSRLGAKHELAAWICVLALGATWPDRPWIATAVGRGRKDQPPVTVEFEHADDAVDRLRDLVRLFDAGMREPLPLPLKTGHAWAEQRRRGANDRACRDAARKQWSERFPENEDAHHVRVWGPDAPLDRLLTEARPDVAVEGETTRLGALAVTLWRPVLERAARS
jgi:exodeoxyribonuclease V gamma subunit